MKRIVASCLALVMSGACFAQGTPEPATLVAGPNATSLTGHVAVLADETGALTLDDVRAPERAAQFAVVPGESVAHGYTGLAYWYRVALNNPGGSSNTQWVLEMQRPVLDYLDVHVTRSDGRTETFLTGDKRPPDARQISHRTFAIAFHLVPGEAVVIHVRAQSAGAHSFQMQAWSRDAFQAHAASENFAYGAFFGAMALIVLYNLLIFLWIRDQAYLYYVLYLAAMIGVGLSFTGYAREWGNTWSASAPDWINASSLVFRGLGNALSWLFVRELLQTRQHAPWFYKTATAMCALAAVVLLVSPMIGFSATDQAQDAMGLAGVAIMLPVAAYLARKGLRSARFYLLAWGTGMLGLVCVILQGVGLLPANAFTTNGWILGVLVGITVLSLALADRITTERRERALAAERANRLTSFLPQKVAELVGGGDKSLLAPKRREVTVCVIDLRGFTPFSETSAPEDVMNVLREFYEAMGAVVEKHGGTVEHFAGDSMLIFFNAPLEVAEPEKHAVQAALEMRETFAALRAKWSKLGHELGLGIGIADGFATIGAIGFSGRSQYAAIGAVTNLAARLCSSAQHGEILTTGRVLAAVGSLVESESVGEQNIKGFHRPVQVARIAGAKSAAEPPAVMTSVPAT